MALSVNGNNSLVYEPKDFCTTVQDLILPTAPLPSPKHLWHLSVWFLHFRAIKVPGGQRFNGLVYWEIFLPWWYPCKSQFVLNAHHSLFLINMNKRDNKSYLNVILRSEAFLNVPLYLCVSGRSLTLTKLLKILLQNVFLVVIVFIFRFAKVEDQKDALRLYTVQIAHKRERKPPPCYLTKWDGRSFLPLLTRPCGNEVISCLSVRWVQSNFSSSFHYLLLLSCFDVWPTDFVSFSDTGTFLGLGTVTGSVAIYIAFSLQVITHACAHVESIVLVY